MVRCTWLRQLTTPGGEGAPVLDDTNEEQAAISSELSLHPRACAFYNPQLVAFWNRTHQNMDTLPLARYLHENFKVVGSLDDFSLLVRNDRDIKLRSR